MRAQNLGLFLGLAVLCAGCRDETAASAPAAPGAPTGASSAATDATSAAGARSATVFPTPREGSVIALSPSAEALYVADEDRSVIRRVPLPLAGAGTTTALPGRPAQLVVAGDRVFVTIRDPGLLLVLRADAGALGEVARVAVPADAWGLALTPDGATAVVTSAWTHQVSAIDVATGALRWSLDVAREPRGVVIAPDGKTAWLSHLVGSALTHVDLSGSGAATRVELPASPLRTRADGRTSASLGYALALSPDGKRLYAPRHALGSLGDWYGAPTVDVLLTDSGQPLAPRRQKPSIAWSALEDDVADHVLERSITQFPQPRAIVYRRSTRTLLVASEGMASLVELDALAIDPAVKGKVQFLGSVTDPTEPAPTRCGAPAGLALSPDEATAWVFCRSTCDVMAVPLDRPEPIAAKDVPGIHLADDTLPAKAARGRRVFFDAADEITSGGVACAGCHPEGREDAHVWLELKGPETGEAIFVGGPAIAGPGMARQTPMLAGRVSGEGPFGWHAQNDDLPARVREGLRLHRWVRPPRDWDDIADAVALRAESLAAFLPVGLVTPPREQRTLTPDEARGRDLFLGAGTGCAGCHVPATGLTNKVAVPLPALPPPEGAIADPNNAFKTPSLLFVGGTAPYWHDGRYQSLDQLVTENEDRMGKTKHLSPEERAALVAYLRTL